MKEMEELDLFRDFVDDVELTFTLEELSTLNDFVEIKRREALDPFHACIWGKIQRIMWESTHIIDEDTFRLIIEEGRKSSAHLPLTLWDLYLLEMWKTEIVPL